MNAPEYLETLRRVDELFEWFLALIPPGAGGSDLRTLTVWLDLQLSAMGVPRALSPPEKLRWVLRHIDWAEAQFKLLWRALPDALRAGLTLDDSLAIGGTTSSEFNGTAYRLPPNIGRGWVIIVPVGAMMLLSGVSALVSARASDSMIRSLVTGGHDRIGHQVPLAAHVWRLAKRGLAQLTRTRPPVTRLSNEMAVLMYRYATLGVVDVPDIVRGFGHIPSEEADFLRFFALEFLLLHECGHVSLDHGGSAAQGDPHGREFEADRWALDALVRLAPTPYSFTAAFLGAVSLLQTAAWVERMVPQGTVAGTHPAAGRRLRRLQEHLQANSMKTSFDVDAALTMAEGLSNTFERMWDASASLRAGLAENGTSLDLLLKTCAREHRPELFKDQFPRWVLCGAPDKLLAALARARVRLESNQPGDCIPESHSRELELVMWAYDAAERGPKRSLASALCAAYQGAQAAN